LKKLRRFSFFSLNYIHTIYGSNLVFFFWIISLFQEFEKLLKIIFFQNFYFEFASFQKLKENHYFLCKGLIFSGILGFQELLKITFFQKNYSWFPHLKNLRLILAYSDKKDKKRNFHLIYIYFEFHLQFLSSSAAETINHFFLHYEHTK
jgi:hypothetical protein